MQYARRSALAFASITLSCSIMLALFHLAVPLAQAAQQGHITVTTTTDDSAVNGNCTLREAIMAANQDAAVDACLAGNGVDTIALPPGTYILTQAGSGDNLASSGDLDLLTSMTIIGGGAHATIIDGFASDRIFDVDPNQTGTVAVTLTGVTLQNGAVVNTDGPWDMDDCCGGIRNYGTLTLTHSVVAHNSAELNGGGIGNIGPSPYLPNQTSRPGYLFISNSTIENNSVSKPGEWGGDGGGILSWAILHIENSTISGNTATGYAGGLVIDHNASLTLNNVTITGNTANIDQAGDGSGGGFTLKPGAILTITNSIIAGNHDPLSIPKPNLTTGLVGHPDCYTYSPSEIIPSGGYNLVGVTDGCSWAFGPGDQAGTSLNPIEPLLGALTSAYGHTSVHIPLFGSPVMEAGNPNHPGNGAGTCAVTDQRGALRPAGAVCDIGAIECLAGVDLQFLFLPNLSK